MLDEKAIWETNVLLKKFFIANSLFKKYIKMALVGSIESSKLLISFIII